tara:strand:+ start:5193 stop:5876 length:684 start_codon:yes stop_codon:yes gene_type:complete
MEWTTIVLGIIVIILIYILYVFFISKSSVISKSANLKEGRNEPVTTINSGQSTRYAYGIWVYVNTWDSTREKTIFSRKDNIRLYLAADEPSLYCTITCLSKDGSSLDEQNILITDNFSIQKWVYINISSDNSIVDAYIDGKLVNSTKLVTSPNQPEAPKLAPVVYGNGWDCYVAGLQNWSNPIGPQEAWDNYMDGNSNALSRFFGSYSLNFAVNKDNVQQSSYTINF